MEFIPFQEVWNNLVYLDNDKIIGGIKISSINFSLLFDEEKDTKVQEFFRCLNSIEYPIKIFSIDNPINLTHNLEILNKKLVNNTNVYKQKVLEEDYQDINFLSKKRQIFNREFYLILEEDISNESLILKKIHTLLKMFNGISLSSSIISSEEWRELLFIMLNPTAPIEQFRSDPIGINNTFKEKICPSGMKILDRDLILGDAFCSTISIVTYPSFVYAGWLGELSNINNTRMVLTISPENSAEVSKNFKKSISDTNAKLINVGDYNDQVLLQNKMQDYVDLVNKIDREHEKFSRMTIQFFCYADSFEELRNIKSVIKNTLSSYGFGATELMFEQERSFKMTLPTMYKELEDNYGLPVPISTVASAFPFVFQNLQDGQDAIHLGRDASGSLALFNIWERSSTRTNSNALIIGKSGSGKSTLVKKLARGEWARGSKIIIIDPEREYKEICEKLHGSWIDCGTGTQGIINPLEVRIGSQNRNDLSRHFQIFRTFIKYYIPDLTPFELTQLEEVLIDIYKEKNIDFETDVSILKNEDFPILDDVYQKVLEKSKNEKGLKKEAFEKISSMLKRATFGADKKLFDGYSTINIDSDFVVLDINSLVDSDETVLKAQFFNVLSWCWNEIAKNKGRIILIVEEAYLLIDPNNPDIIDFLKRTVKRIRKKDGALINISQNLIDFTAPSVARYGEAILGNSGYYFLFSQSKKEATSAQKLLELSESETQFLTVAGKGETLFIASHDIKIPLKIELRDEEAKLFGNGGGR